MIRNPGSVCFWSLACLCVGLGECGSKPADRRAIRAPGTPLSSWRRRRYRSHHHRWLSPACRSSHVNSAGFTLTVNGTGFVSGAAVSFAYTTLTTTYVSATKLTAQVPASLLSGTGSYYVSVTDPGGSSSNSVEFDIDNLDPSLGNVSPSAVVAGTAPSAIVINGSNFMNGATVLWNGKPVATTYVNSQQLQATPTKGELGAPGIVQLSVSNPSPGGVSPAVEFNVTYPAKVTVLDLPANNLVWDPFAQRVYAARSANNGTASWREVPSSTLGD